MRRRVCLVVLLPMLFSRPVLAQGVSNVRAQSEGKVVGIVYDLADSAQGKTYTVAIYALLKNKRTPLTYVEGDVGAGVKAGLGKKIVWSARREFDQFKGSLRFEVEATPVLSPLVVLSPVGRTVYRRGKSYPLTWSGGNGVERVQLELYDQQGRSTEVQQTANQGQYVWAVPARTKPGSDYKLKISGVGELNNTALSEGFRIRRKTSPLLKVLPVAGLVSGLAFFLLNSTRTKAPVPEPVLPAPPLNPG